MSHKQTLYDVKTDEAVGVTAWYCYDVVCVHVANSVNVSDLDVPLHFSVWEVPPSEYNGTHH